MSDDASGTYFRVTGDSEHILSNFHHMITDTGTMQGIVVLNDRLMKK